jgi:Na+/proline symporter
VNDVLLTSPAWLLAVLSIGLSCLCSVGMLALLRRLIARPDEHHNEVLGMLLSIGGIFCAIVVALVVFAVWDHLTTARQAEVDEGATLIVLYRDADSLPVSARAEVEASIRDYTASMIRDEFPLLSRGRSSDRTEISLNRMSVAVHRYLGGTSAPDAVSSVARAQYGLVLAGRETMPPLLWALLLGTCVLLFLMAGALFMENIRYQSIGSVLMGCAVGAALYLILMADHPFTGPLQVRPIDLEENLHTYALIEGGAAQHTGR